MDHDEALDFLQDHHHAVLSTFRRDGQPQLSPVTVATDTDGKVVVSTREAAMKTRNLRRDPRVSLVVLQDGFFGSYVQLEGTAEIVPLPEAMEGLVAYYRAVAGEHPDWDDYRRAMVDQARVLIRIDVTRVGPNRSG